MKTTLATILLAASTGACVSTVGATNGRDDRPTATDCTDVEVISGLTLTRTDVSGIPKHCFTVSGNLVISRTDLTNLDLLKDLVDVNGELRIEDNAKLTSLGLTGVGVDGEIVIDSNPVLANLDGLEYTKTLDALTIRSNAKLTNLGGLRALTTVSGPFELSDNQALARLAGLEHLTQVTGHFQITANDALTNLQGLGRVNSLGDLTIENNLALSSVSGLAPSNLTIGGSLRISQNPALQSLTGMDPKSVTRDVDINGNGIRQIAGLTSLTAVGGNFIIAGNASLTGVDGLAPSLRVTNGIQVTNNASLSSVFSLYVGMSAASLSITGNGSLSRNRVGHLSNTNTDHPSHFPIRNIQGNSGSNSPDPEPHTAN